MSNVITAIYEQGTLHPLTPLNLQEHQHVQIHILPETTNETTDHLLEMLTMIGVLTPPSGQAQETPLSEAERQRLAQSIGQATQKPLSELIIEDRGDV